MLYNNSILKTIWLDPANLEHWHNILGKKLIFFQRDLQFVPFNERLVQNLTTTPVHAIDQANE